MVKPILYSYWRSSCSWRVRIALNLKGVDYEYKTVNLLSQESMNEPDFVKANPTKKVPALVVGDEAIGESLAIIEFLEEAYPGGAPLLPKCAIKRAQARAIALQVTAGIQPLQNLRILKVLNAEEAGKGAKWANHWLIDGLRDLEALVSKTAGKYCVGDEVTIADLCIPSILYNAKRFNVDINQFPLLVKINDELSKIEAFQKAEPDHQPDANLNA